MVSGEHMKEGRSLDLGARLLFVLCGGFQRRQLSTPQGPDSVWCVFVCVRAHARACVPVLRGECQFWKSQTER